MTPSERFVRAHRETVAGQLRYRIGIGDDLALSISKSEAVELRAQLNEFDELEDNESSWPCVGAGIKERQYNSRPGTIVSVTPGRCVLKRTDYRTTRIAWRNLRRYQPWVVPGETG